MPAGVTFATVVSTLFFQPLTTSPSPCIIASYPTPFVYVRFHGATGKYRGSYRRGVLARWAGRLTTAIDGGLDAYAYFNNDLDGAAIRNAETLRELCGRR